MNNFERKTSRKYLFEMIGAFVVYGILLTIARRLHPSAETFEEKLLLSLLPMAGIALVIWAIGRAILRADELQRAKILEILAWASGTTMFLTLTYGFLEFGIGLPRLSMFLVWPVMAICWIVTGIIYGILGKAEFLWPWSRK